MDELAKQMEKDRDEIIARIAREQLGITDLAARNLDRLDFHEVHVTALRGALESAYFSGRAASAAAIARHLADKAQEGSH